MTDTAEAGAGVEAAGGDVAEPGAPLPVAEDAMIREFISIATCYERSLLTGESYGGSWATRRILSRYCKNGRSRAGVRRS